MNPTLQELVNQAVEAVKALGPEHRDETGCPDPEQIWYLSEYIANDLTDETATQFVEAIMATPQNAFYGAEMALDGGTPKDCIAAYLYDQVSMALGIREQ